MATENRPVFGSENRPTFGFMFVRESGVALAR